MRTFNKVVTVIGLLLAFVLLPVIAAIPLEILNTLRDFMFGAETSLTTGARLLVAALAVVLWVIAVILLWLEFRPSRQSTIRVAAVEGGTATVQALSVERRIEQALLALPAVQAAQARVEQAKNGVSADLTLDTDADVNVPDVTGRAIQRTRYLLENEVGAAVSAVNVKVRHVAGRMRRAAPASAAPASAAAPVAESVAPVVVPPPSYTAPAVVPEVAPAPVGSVVVVEPEPVSSTTVPPAVEPAPEAAPVQEWTPAVAEPEPPAAEGDGLPGDQDSSSSASA